MISNRWIQLLAVLAVVGLLMGVSLLTPSIDQDRRELQLTYETDEEDQTIPPTVALATAALGSFRSFVVDALWYRAHNLKQAGKFYEANQLSQWISHLQPRFPQVWDFHAWNMAYNISVATHTADERWYWVNSGISLLRDKGIPLNPRTPYLYKQLGWMFAHKIGQISDDMHWYYKRKLAEEWQELLGTPSEGTTIQQAVEPMRRIARAPNSLSQLLADKPQPKALWEYLEGLGYEADVTLLRQIGGILMYNYSPDQMLWQQLGIQIPEQYDQRLDRIFKDTAFGPSVEPLLAYLRKRALIDTYHMDPDVMVEVMEQFGPLDWRHPAAHGCYWDHLGVKVAREIRNPGKIDIINIYRARIQAIQQLAFWGKVSFDPQMPDPPDLLPDLRFVEMYERALDKAKAYFDEIDAREGTRKSFESGHENFLQNYLLNVYLLGDRDAAQRVYDDLRRLYGHRPHNKDRYKLTLDEQVMKEFRDTRDIKTTVRGIIRDAVFRALHQGLGGRRPQWYDHGIKMAQAVHKEYHSDKGANVGAPRDRQKLGTFVALLADDYIDYMTRPNFSITRRSRVWHNTPLELQQRVYDRLRPHFLALAQVGQFDVSRIFSEPAGMDQYRKRQKRRPSPLDKQMEGAATIERK